MNERKQKAKKEGRSLGRGWRGISSFALRYQVFLFPTVRSGKEQAGLFVLKNEPQSGVGVGVGGGAEGPGEAACLH